MSVSPTEQTACVIFSKPNLFYYQIPSKKVFVPNRKSSRKSSIFHAVSNKHLNYAGINRRQEGTTKRRMYDCVSNSART